MQSKAQDPALEVLIHYYNFFIGTQTELKHYTILPDDETQKLDLFYRDNLASLINIRDDLINKVPKEQLQEKLFNLKLPRSQNDKVKKCVTYYLQNTDVSYDVNYESPFKREANNSSSNNINFDEIKNSLEQISNILHEQSDNIYSEKLDQILEKIDTISNIEFDYENLRSQIENTITESKSQAEMDQNLELLKSVLDNEKYELNENILEIKTALTNATNVLNQYSKISGQLMDSTTKTIIASQEKIIPNLRGDIQSALKSELVNFFQQTNKIVLANSQQIVELERQHKRTNTTILIITVGAIIFTSVASSFIAAKFYTNKLMGYITIGKTHK